MDLLKTKTIRLDADHPDDKLLLPAAEALRRGELVAFPTETVYGLGANALDPVAVASIFAAKGRPADNPLIVHIASLADLPRLVREISPLARKLFETFSPGPLTLIMHKATAVPDLVTAGLDTVAVRIPSHPVARRLIELAGVPVAAPSANRSGRPSPTRGWHVAADLAGRIAYLIESGSSYYGLESTVVDVTGAVPVILRPGAITAAAIQAATGQPVAAAGQDVLQPTAGTPRSPGMKYRHYAPKARVIIVDDADPAERYSHMAAAAAQLQAIGKPVGLFVNRQGLAGLTVPLEEIDLSRQAADWPALEKANGESGNHQNAIAAVIYGDQPSGAAAGATLFDALRSLDQLGVSVIIAEGLPEQGVGAAYMNRLRKAAAGD